jgi:acetoin utilization protein AcuC
VTQTRGGGASARPLMIGSEIYRGSSYGPWHPLRVPRVSTVLDLVRAMEWLPREDYRTSPMARPAALALWHDTDYIAAVQATEAAGTVTAETRARYHLGTPANPVFDAMYRRPATSAGGVMLAAELLRDGGVIHVPGGGTHHGLPGRANGFCYFNDPVLGMLVLRRAGVRRLAYVDIDAHHCDGVEAGFAGDPEALLISVHEEGRWPFTGRLEDDGGGNCFNLPVPRGFNDSEMRAVLEEVILPRLAAFAPDAVILQCGADALADDPMSRLGLSNNAHWGVVVALRHVAPRFLVLGGGGYNPWSVARCWAGVWAVLAGKPVPGRLPEAAEAVLRGLEWRGHSKGKAPPAHWFTTLRDDPAEGPVRAALRARIAVLARR